MNLLAVERIKLFSTRSPWWCMLIVLVLATGLSALVTGLSPVEEISVGSTQFGSNLAGMVVIVLAAIAVTSEYRFGTIKATFTAVPNRTAVLVAKAAVVAVVAAVIGEITAFAAWGVGRLMKPGIDLAINTEPEWRNVAGVGLIYAISAVIAVAVGTMVRHTAAAISILLVWALLVESLIGLIPRVGDDILRWLPFNAGNHFLTAGMGAAAGEGGGFGLNMPFGPLGSVAYMAAIALGLLAIAIVLAERRDA
jgi:ABC-2 type transport system permease protein